MELNHPFSFAEDTILASKESNLRQAHDGSVYQKKWPVLLINFRRPRLTRKLLEAISQSGDRQLYFFCDGPRNELEGSLTRQVQAGLEDFHWESEPKLLLPKENFGCRKGVEAAIDWLMSEEVGGIILEDDCLPSPEFFEFADHALSAYESVQEVMMISGYSPVAGHKYFQGNYSHDFCLVGATWGWATWSRSWKFHDRNLELLGAGRAEAQVAKLKSVIPVTMSRLIRGYAAVRDCSLDTWDYQWAIARLVNSGLSVVPPGSLVKNIGFEGDGTHTRTIPWGLERKLYGKQLGPVVTRMPEINWRLVAAIERKERNLAALKVLRIRFVRIQRSVDSLYLVSGGGRVMNLLRKSLRRFKVG
jgi:hypothetical protein